jgi:tRNA pseudouridine13 synthase
VKLKVRPADFQVEERLGLRPGRRGRYSLYRLEKEGWNTLDVIRELEYRHHLRGIRRAGLKDRHTQSIQYLSIPGPGPPAITAQNWKLTFVGRSDEPISHAALLGNRFSITLRDLAPDEVAAINASFPHVMHWGIPNYYDEQRMGSARHKQGFIARRLIAGHHNGALKFWLATPSAADDRRTREEKQAALDHWGDWSRCREHVPPEARAALDHLVEHPKDTKGAVRLIPRPLLELFLNAWQSWVWNETLTLLIDQCGVAVRRRPYSHGTFLFYEQLTDEAFRDLRELIIPTPGPGTKFGNDRVAAAMTEVLARDGLELSDLKLKFRLRGLFFKSWDRPAIVVPENPARSRPGPDELFPGRQKLTISFVLPPGSYATMVVKRLTR